jgi:S-adenosylmethionine:tRNA ribosyltransferase-isomerase
MILMNNTKVFPARIVGFKQDGGRLEMLLVRKLDDGSWEVLTRGNYSGTIRIADTVHVEIENGRKAKFLYPGSFRDMVWTHGNMPLPPYIKRLPDDLDKTTYQTVYAREEGSIAAPTAGLHFTQTLLDRIQWKGVLLREITLHVGIGTFRPVRTETVHDHRMDEEFFEIDSTILSEIRETKAAGKKIVVIGTTTARAIEGYMSGRCRVTSLNGKVQGTTDIFIYPGYIFQTVGAMVTNFHLPRSTPLMLVSALCGFHTLLGVYRDAITKGYRFLSYGDAMLIL